MLTIALPQLAPKWRPSSHLRDIALGVVLWRGEYPGPIQDFMKSGLCEPEEENGRSGQWAADRSQP